MGVGVEVARGEHGVVNAIANREEADKLIGVYEEESNSINLALELYPAKLASPMNYSS